jgi:CubicO group peptidase (beta-lactamase class C family)
VNRVFATWAATDGPGCAVGVARNEQIVYENGYGMANLETATPITPASIFHVASVSKQFTAMAIALLARDGKLSLDDDIRRYLPEIPNYGHRITIRHLLNHTSGLRDQWDLLFMARGRFEENRITESDVLEIVARQKALNFVPGTEYVYSNTGYTLAGRIVKRVSGKSLREFADERIFKPLGMTNTQLSRRLHYGREGTHRGICAWHRRHVACQPAELRYVRRDEPVHDRR